MTIVIKKNGVLVGHPLQPLVQGKIELIKDTSQTFLKRLEALGWLRGAARVDSTGLLSQYLVQQHRKLSGVLFSVEM